MPVWQMQSGEYGRRSKPLVRRVTCMAAGENVHSRGWFTSTKSLSEVADISGVGKLELRVCAASCGFIKSVKHENRPAEKKAESKQVVITCPGMEGYCLCEGLCIHSEYVGSRVLLPVCITQGFNDHSFVLDQGIHTE